MSADDDAQYLGIYFIAVDYKGVVGDNDNAAVMVAEYIST